LTEVAAQLGTLMAQFKIERSDDPGNYSPQVMSKTNAAGVGR